MTLAVSSTTWFVGIASGVGLGSVYALVASSFTLVITSTGYFNFALISIVTVGTVAAYETQVGFGYPPLLAGAVVVGIGALLGLASERLAVRPLQGRSTDDHQAVLVGTIALSLVLQSVTALTWGTTSERVPAYVGGPPIMIGDVPVRRVYVVMTLVLIVFTLLFECILRRTRAGRLLRASQEDRVGAELLGVDVRRVVLVVFAIAGGVAALAGFLIAPVSFASPFVGMEVLLFGFTAMALGGFGSFIGAVFGGLLVGQVVSLSPLVLPAASTRPLIFVMILAILLVAPNGLFGARVVREV